MPELIFQEQTTPNGKVTPTDNPLSSTQEFTSKEDYIQVQSPTKLQMSEKVSLEDIQGLGRIKKTLTDNIQVPLEFGYLYDMVSGGSSTGRISVKKVLSVYGAEGSGKNLLVRAFCSANGIGLLEVPFWQFDPVNHPKKIHDTAVAFSKGITPVIIYLEDCEGHYTWKTPSGAKSINPDVIPPMRGMLKKIKESPHPIWVIFSSVVPINRDVFHPAIDGFIDSMIWSGLLERGEVYTVLRNSILKRTGQGQELPLSSTSLEHIASMSKFNVPREIDSYVSNVYRKKALKLARENRLTRKEKEDLELVKDVDDNDFRAAMKKIGGETTITRYHPFIKNASPYGVQDYQEVDY